MYRLRRLQVGSLRVLRELLRPDGIGNPLLLEWPLHLLLTQTLGERLTELFHRVPYRRGNLLPTCVRETNVQDAIAVSTRHFHSTIHRLEDIRLDEFSLTEDADPRAVPVEQVAVLDELFEFDLRHVHQGIDFVFRPLEVLDTEGVDRDVSDARLVAYFEDLLCASTSALDSSWRIFHFCVGDRMAANVLLLELQTLGCGPRQSPYGGSLQIVYSHPSRKPHVWEQDLVSTPQLGVLEADGRPILLGVRTLAIGTGRTCVWKSCWPGLDVMVEEGGECERM